MSKIIIDKIDKFLCDEEKSGCSSDIPTTDELLNNINHNFQIYRQTYSLETKIEILSDLFCAMATFYFVDLQEVDDENPQ